MIIGLTGGIASGKTFCSEWFATKGVPIVDADIIAREVVLPNTKGLTALHTLLGNEILNIDGTLNRSVLREKIFQDNQIKSKVNQILHPEIRIRSQLLLKQLSKKYSFVIYSVPLLFETGADKVCDMVVCIDVPEQEQITRGSVRDGVTQKDIINIIKSQISRRERLARCNFVINNSDTKLQTVQQCEQLFMVLSQINTKS